MIKKILRSKPVQEFICFIAWIYIWFVYVTTSWEKIGFEHTKKLAEAGKPFIFVFWHGRLLMAAPFSPKRAKINVVSSSHNDGQLIARVMEYFGFRLIRGSSNKKDSVAALKNIILALKRNEIVTITPDGPRGPRMRLGGNVIRIAQMQNVPIIPVTYSISRCRILRSWDRFMLAKPFSKGIFIYGEPIYPCLSDDEEELKKAGTELENRLNNLTMDADKKMGVMPVEPA